MEERTTYNFQQIRKVLMILSGVKIIKKPELGKLLNTIYLVVLTAVLCGLITLAILTVVVARQNISIILEASQFIVVLLIITFGLLNAIYHINDLDEAATKLEKGIFKYDEHITEEMKQIQIKGVNEIVWMTKLFTVYIIFSGISYLLFVPLKELISPGTDVNRPLNKLLPLPLYIPFDTNNAVGYFAALPIHLACMYCIIVLVLSIDEVYISLMIQIRIQFQLLNNSLKNLENRAMDKYTEGLKRNHFKNNKEMYDNLDFKKYIYNCLQENIKHHQQLIRYCKLVEPYLGTTFFIIVALSSLIIAATGYLVTVYNNTAEELLKFCIVLLSELLFVLHFCWFGEDVATESEKIFHVLYSTHWFKCDRQFNKLVDIMMVNSKRPFRLYSNMYKIPASLETFYSIVSSSYTYLNLLRQQKQTSN